MVEVASASGRLAGESLFLPIEEAESSIIRQGVDYWCALRGSRPYPERAEVTLRGLARLAKYAVLVRVLDGGADYEFRFVGNVPVSAIGDNFQGRCTSEPEVGKVMRANYRVPMFDHVVRTVRPWLFKSRAVEPAQLGLPVCSETVYLPLGPDGGAIDHLLGFTVFSAVETW